MNFKDWTLQETKLLCFYPYTLTLPDICNPLTGCFQAAERVTALLHRAEYCSVYGKWLHGNCTISCKT
jgi:hypothetical protein